MAEKLKIHLIYSPITTGEGILYENDQAIITTSAVKKEDTHNIAMSWYSNRDPLPNDSLLLIEPRCVSEIDYDPNFLARFKYIFTWATKAITDPSLQSKVIEINHPSCHTLPDPHNLNNPTWQQRKNKVIVINNNKSSNHFSSEAYSLRIQLADLFYKKSKFTVEWYGQGKLDKPYYKGSIVSKQEVLKNAKFSICTENCYDPIYSYNYFTEKLPEVLFNSTVPLYLGCYNIDDFVSRNLYIDLRDYCKRGEDGGWKITAGEALIQRVEGYEDFRYANFVEDLKHLMLRAQPTLFHTISYERFYQTLIGTFSSRS